MLSLQKTHKRNIQFHFDRAAKKYDYYASLQNHIGQQLLKYLPSFQKSLKIADIGAGTGKVTSEIYNLFSVSALFCVDLSPKMLEICGEQLRGKKAEMVCADFDNLPFGDNQLDLVFSSMTLQWSLNLQETLKELIRCLQPGGILAFSLFVENTLYEFRQQLNINDFYTENYIETSLRSLPISILANEKHCYQRRFSQLYDLAQFFKLTGANYVINKTVKTLNRKNFRCPIEEANFNVIYWVVRKNA